MAALSKSSNGRPATADHRFQTHKALQVLIVDDDDLFRRAVRTLLETVRRLTVVGEAADGEQAIKLATQLAPHVILMDLDIPGVARLEAITQLARQTPSARVIVLTGSNDPRSIELAKALARPAPPQVTHRRYLWTGGRGRPSRCRRCVVSLAYAFRNPPNPRTGCFRSRVEGKSR